MRLLFASIACCFLLDAAAAADMTVKFENNMRVSETLVVFGADSGGHYQRKLVTEGGKPFTSKAGFCSFAGTMTPITGPSFSAAVLDNGTGKQWIIYVSGGFPKHPQRPIESAHIAYFKCHRW